MSQQKEQFINAVKEGDTAKVREARAYRRNVLHKLRHRVKAGDVETVRRMLEEDPSFADQGFLPESWSVRGRRLKAP